MKAFRHPYLIGCPLKADGASGRQASGGRHDHGRPAWLCAERGSHGHVDHLLLPLRQHPVLCPGGSAATVLISGGDRFTAKEGEIAAKELRDRLLALPTTHQIGYRTQNGGDYDENLALRPDVAPGRTGLSAHPS